MRLILKHICGHCHGIGEIGEPPTGCETCEGTGELYWGHADALMDELDEIDTRLGDMKNKLDDVMDKCNDIFEAVTES